MDQAMSEQSDPTRRRQPLTDASSRVNHSRATNIETPRVRVENLDQLKTPDHMSVVMAPNPRDNKENQRLSVATDIQPESARNSVVSAVSILSNKGKRKTHVGPWQLGRTLGKGATGRVRLAKHALTGQTAAIKIVSKKSAAMVQSESIAAMDRTASQFAGVSNARQIPCGIEREVVIMKLIEHPNVISLYDVWENRGELYLVLEYVEGGELFDYVSNNGPLPEEEAVRLFRQIIAGLGYCHRFNICHRDLKPENILLDGNHNVKLADFGMAALQPAGHWLNTSCGSPHYAAPEIIYGRKYRGDRADMWSCGIILYALLTGYLPFDGGDLANTLRLVKKGDYMIPPELSDEAADLIQRILQKRPEDRITMQNIWLHPLLTKYEKLHNAMADHYIGPPPPLSIKDCGEPVTSRDDVDPDILRNLQTLWHDVKPEVLIDRLMCLEPTHERMFYNALVKFRDEQLENYQGQPLEYSASDYHHISRPGDRVRRGRSSFKRRSQVSTVKDLNQRMSSTKEPKSSASIESYDPYKSPKAKTPAKEVQYAQITIHRGPGVPGQGEASPAVKPPPSIFEEEEEEEPEDVQDAVASPFTVLQKRKHKPSSMKSFQSSRVLHSSSRYPGLSTRSTSYRRNVSFHHVRNRSQGSAKPKRRRTGTNQHSDIKRSPSAASLQMIADALVVPDIPSSPPLPAQPTVVRSSGTKAKSLARERKVSDIIWTEDARKVSNELGKICEEAFNGSSITTMHISSSATGYETPATLVSMPSPEQRPALSAKQTLVTPLEIPNEPGQSYSIQELTETRRKLVEHSKGQSDSIPAYLTGVIGHLDRLIEEDQVFDRSRRKLEESKLNLVDPFSGGTEDTSLPVINEEFASPVRAPSEYSPMPRFQKKQRAPAAPSRTGDGKTTIRMVPHSSLRSLEEVKPLMIRKKVQINDSDAINSDSAETSRNFSQSSRQSRPIGVLEPIEEIPVSPKGTADSKKWSWFKHRSQASNAPPSLPVKDVKPIVPSTGTVIVNPPQDLSHPDAPSPIMVPDERRVPTRKSSMERFGGGFLKKFMPKKSNKSLSHPETDISRPKSKENRNSAILCNGLPDQESSFDSVDALNPPRNKRLSLANQNWFARVFQIKPASRVIALNTTKVKGRKEIYKLLREWKEYGMENVYMDKTNSSVHGRVSEVNFLRLREVEFIAEFYTVLEHGRQANLSLVRFTQERGAASSFNKVVDTVYMMMKYRGLVVEDPVRAKRMARVLDSFTN